MRCPKNLFSFSFLIFIDVWLMYSVVPISAVEHSDSVTHMCAILF